MTSTPGYDEPALPSSWLLQNLDLIPARSRVLDVACGSGRNALFLARVGFSVTAVDRDGESVRSLNEAAAKHQLDLEAAIVDLESGKADLGRQQYDAVVVMRYLHRPLFPALVAAVVPGGLLIYETFTVEQATRVRPRNPAFLLHRGELSDLVRPLEVIRSREGDFEGMMVSGVVARQLANLREIM